MSVDYELDVNHEPLADCRIRMNITSKNSGGVLRTELKNKCRCRKQIHKKRHYGIKKLMGSEFRIHKLFFDQSFF